jgi:glycosyltransferase involved in cell wall biosynthesis
LSTEPTPELSVVIPLLNEQESLAELASRIDAAIGSRPYEILFVDDGSTDGSWDVIASLASADSRIKGIRFRRNYGKSFALQKGFERARGAYIATMDADLQDDPNELTDMFAMLDSGYDLVSGWKQVRHDPISKTIPSKFFNGVTSRMSGIELHDFNCGLKVYKREVIESIELYGEMHRYIPLLAKWQGFSKIGEKVVTHHARKYGKTKFGFSRFMNGFLDLITLMFIHKYMNKPMHFFGTLGFVSLSTGGAIVTYLAFMRVFYNEYLSNRPLLLFGILLLVMGVQLFSIGFVGEMLNNSEKRGRKVNIRDEVGA